MKVFIFIEHGEDCMTVHNSLVSAEVDRGDVAVCDEMRQLFLGVVEMVNEMFAGTFCLFVLCFIWVFLAI